GNPACQFLGDCSTSHQPPQLGEERCDCRGKHRSVAVWGRNSGPGARPCCRCRILLERTAMNFLVFYLLFLKASVSSFSGLASLPILREDLVVKRQVLTDR